jgi:hypothetical protein
MLADHQRDHPISRLPIPPVRRIDPNELRPVELSLFIDGIASDEV